LGQGHFSPPFLVRKSLQPPGVPKPGPPLPIYLAWLLQPDRWSLSLLESAPIFAALAGRRGAGKVALGLLVFQRNPFLRRNVGIPCQFADKVDRRLQRSALVPSDIATCRAGFAFSVK
jgi:hypothetical protein